MDILFVASEGFPFSSSGGLGDVIGSLPPALKEARGDLNVSVILPYYRRTKEAYSENTEFVFELSFYLSWRSLTAKIYKSEYKNVSYYFVENDYYFDRENLYGEWDDGERFAFFSKAVIEFILKRGAIPDILHANDWQTALSVIYLKTLYKSSQNLAKIRTLYTIHNIEYQGKFDTKILGDVFGIEDKYKSILEFDGNVNLMKGALTVSDSVSTVSPNYKNELNHNFFAYGLAEIIRSVSHKTYGVINGIDEEYYSPMNADIYFPYDENTIDKGKRKNKEGFQQEFGLIKNDKIPLIVMISRLTEGKGIDLLLHIIDELLNSANIEFAILGTGEKKYEDALNAVAKRHENFKAIIKFDKKLSKKMYAAADIFLMPSKSEPCGLAQMIACRYAAVPIVRAVGGLYDSIKPYFLEGGNGLLFENFNAHELLYTIKEALQIYENKELFSKIRKNAIKTDFSWRNSALKYIAIYDNLLKW